MQPYPHAATVPTYGKHARPHAVAGRFCLRNETGDPLRFGPATAQRAAEGARWREVAGGGAGPATRAAAGADADADADGGGGGGRGVRVVAHGESCCFDYWHYRADEQAGGGLPSPPLSLSPTLA